MRHSSILAPAGICAAAALTPAALARPDAGPGGVQITPLAHGTIAGGVDASRAGIRISTAGPRQLLVTAMTVAPGGSFGWHRHPGPVLVAVSAGTLTVYEPGRGGCERSAVRAGDAFVESGADVHLARNEGSTPVRLNAIFLAPTGTSGFLQAVPEPKGCTI